LWMRPPWSTQQGSPPQPEPFGAAMQACGQEACGLPLGSSGSTSWGGRRPDPDGVDELLAAVAGGPPGQLASLCTGLDRRLADGRAARIQHNHRAEDVDVLDPLGDQA